MNDPPNTLYAAIKVRKRSLICRFIRSRRCWNVICVSRRMPTPSSVTRTMPNNVARRLCQELKSRLRKTLTPSVLWRPFNYQKPG